MLTDQEIDNILIAGGYSCRHRKRPISELQSMYEAKLRRKASHFVNDWCLNGVPRQNWEKIKSCISLVTKYKLFEQIVQDERNATHPNLDEVKFCSK